MANGRGHTRVPKAFGGEGDLDDKEPCCQRGAIGRWRWCRVSLRGRLGCGRGCPRGCCLGSRGAHRHRTRGLRRCAPSSGPDTTPSSRQWLWGHGRPGGGWRELRGGPAAASCPGAGGLGRSTLRVATRAWLGCPRGCCRGGALGRQGGGDDGIDGLEAGTSQRQALVPYTFVPAVMGKHDTGAGRECAFKNVGSAQLACGHTLYSTHEHSRGGGGGEATGETEPLTTAHRTAPPNQRCEGQHTRQASPTAARPLR